MTATKQEMLDWLDGLASGSINPCSSREHLSMMRWIGDAIYYGAVPEGWKLVPVDPTEAMLDVAALSMFAQESIPETYKAMLSLAPKPEELK